MVTLQAEETVKEITSTIDIVYHALVKEFQLEEQGDDEKEAIRLVGYSLRPRNSH